jgi:membrane protein DedA with SNARE-associated domain/pimeloyl-ACP methyl ester carboxylesterase
VSSNRCRRRSRWRLPIYLALLAVSALISHSYTRKGHPTETQQMVQVWEVARGVRTDRPVDLAYRVVLPETATSAIPVILLHGSPMAGQTFKHFAERFPNHPVIIPDLPGFGGSQRKIADFSIAAHADYVVQLMDHLEIERAHLVGYSQSGGVVIHIADQVPERTASLVLFAGIGAQEVELLGDYALNHALYTAQYIILGGLQHLFPHMSLLDRSLLNVYYARNFKDSDQRPLRRYLQAYAGPALIINGRADTQVPITTAQEHARILPQSETAYFDGGHIKALMHPEIAVDPMLAFFARVEDGTAKTRATADPERVVVGLESYVRKEIAGPGLVVIMVLLVLAVQAGEDLTLIGAGILVFKGVLGFWPAVFACYIGLVAGDCGIYLLGRFLGRPALRKRPLRWFISQKKVDVQSHRFSRKMFLLVFGSRFLPGARVPFYFAAGMLRVGFFRFTVYQAFAALFWTPLLVGISVIFGQTFLDWFASHKHLALYSLVGLIVLLWFLFHKLLPLVTWRGRRMWIGTWRRRVHWEFWPRWFFYPPIALYVLGLILRYRSLRLCMLANPGMPFGGFLRESKHEIFTGLQGAGEPLLPWTRIPADLSIAGQLQQLDAYLEARQFDYPIVIKPDIGYRGQGVGVVANESEARDFLDHCPVDVVVQPCVKGLEFGIFYMRSPDQPTGGVTSITAKEMPFVAGDGTATLEQLILRDERAVCMAPFFIDKFGDHIFDIPDAGERIPLTQLGTHARGAIFLDRCDLITPALDAEIDRISRCYEGFYFGRYDIRVPSIEDLQAGRNISILELNGLTSESTHIYDSRHSVFYGWRTLCQQWKQAFEISAINRAAGHAPDSYPVLWNVLRDWMTESTDYEAPLSVGTVFKDHVHS